MSETTQDQLTEAEQAEAERQAIRAERRNAIIQPLIESVQQREKFLLADRLGRPYSELMEDPDRVMVALAWLKLKRNGGHIAPGFDQLLDMTDQQLLEVIGLDKLDDDDAAEQGKDD